MNFEKGMEYKNLLEIRDVENLGRNQNSVISSMMPYALKIYNDYVQTRFAVLPSDHRYNSMCLVMDERKKNTSKYSTFIALHSRE